MSQYSDEIKRTGGRVMTSNPSSEIDGSVMEAAMDKKGRFVMIPYQIRDLTATAACTLSTNKADNETTLLAGTANTYHDLIYVTGVTTSDQAIRVVFRETTAGTDLFSMVIPASSSNKIEFPVPWNQNEAGGTWVVDFAINAAIADPNDVTNTTVNILAAFVKNT